jgi:hypothetical protein
MSPNEIIYALQSWPAKIAELNELLKADRAELAAAKAEASHYMAVAQKATDELIFFRADNLKAHQMTCAAGLELTRLRAELEVANHSIVSSLLYNTLKETNARLRAEVERWKTVAAQMTAEREHNANEASRLRAEVERLTTKIGNQADRIRYLEGATNHATGTPLSQAIARAEKAEAELADWSVLNLWGGTPEIIHEFIKGQQTRIHHCQDLEAELDSERARLDYLALNMGIVRVAEALNCDCSKTFPIRDAIDLAMKKETPTP